MTLMKKWSKIEELKDELREQLACDYCGCDDFTDKGEQCHKPNCLVINDDPKGDFSGAEEVYTPDYAK